MPVITAVYLREYDRDNIGSGGKLLSENKP